jgi:hypothetical protein
MFGADYTDLIAAAHSQLQALVVLCWDNLNTHAVMRKFTDAHPDWFLAQTGLTLEPERP